MHVRKTLAAAGLALASWACGDASSAPTRASSATMVSVTFANLPSLDAASEGSYAAWIVERGQPPRLLGRFVAAPALSFPLSSQISDDAELRITVQPANDAAPNTPSAQMLLRGAFRDGRAELTVVGAVTQGDLPLRSRPGQFTMFSPSDNAVDGYPSFEESGVWLFNMSPRATDQGDMWVRLSQLNTGWTYEGWMVRDIGQANAIWLSYGKFTPDYTGALNSRDDNGWGAFSGVSNFRTLGEE
jgi:hypothetical protein